jgi:hypothetical protein
LWETTLPFAGNATPITYEVNGRQFVVIAAGGGKDPGSPSGGMYVAFALPKNSAPGGSPDPTGSKSRVLHATPVN